ncbi:polysaccharide lyase family 8 super-sandwich domain-containing protein [Nonomuraea sp. NPDC050540]|uniref:polysaccharide lyase family 8 super-sandwich domain-containing protein n=1 Tax=Nonomuraea sp. NPDC050540 TaxID=3364367 RepID=UPI003793FFA1
MSEAADTIRARLLAALHREAGPPPAAPGPDGLWADIDYADLDVTIWAPFEHLVRLRALAPAEPEPAGRALDAWLRMDLRCPNWWYDQLGAPRVLGDAALLLGIAHDPRLTRILGRAAVTGMTGQNLLWAAEVVIRRCLLDGDDEGLAEAFGQAATLLVPSEGEGIQPDHSFHQHGPQLYSGGYGHSFAVDMAALATLASGTPMAMPEEAMEVLAAYLLDGQRWMIHAGRYDIACMGRESTREGNAARGPALEAAARSLAAGGGPRAEELLHFGQGPGTGARYFWRSDYLAVYRPGWSAAVKTSSTRTVLSEAGNGEGLSGRHLCDGVTHLWRTGEEYHALWPVQDWRHLPGTTVAYRGGPLPAADFGQDTGGSDFAGGLTEGPYAMAAMHLDRDGVRARKSWFFFLDEYVALGAGITCADPDVPVHTTIDQTTLTGEVRLADGTLHHNGVTYFFPHPAPLTVRSGARSGSWAAVNRSQSARELSADVLEIWLDHGRAPSDASYAYLAVPGPPADTLTAPRPLTVLANTPGIQAVRHSTLDLTQIVFHRPGTLALPGGSITTDRPILVQVRGPSALSAACPFGTGGQANLTLDHHGTTRELALSLPPGPTLTLPAAR